MEVDLSEATGFRRAALALGLVLAASGCDELRLAATNLEILPNPAQPGQTVSFSFTLTVIPAHEFAIVATVDGTQEVRLTRFEAADGPFVVEIGDAADLISRYGLGQHVGAIEVRLIDGSRTARADRTFELQEPPPPAASPQMPGERGT